MGNAIRAEPQAAASRDDPVLRAALDYWQGKRGDRPMPRRADLDPLEVPRLLPFIFLVDVDGEAVDFTYRLVGTDIVDNTADDYTGRRLSEIRGEGTQGELMDLYRRVCETRKPALERIRYLSRSGNRKHYLVAVAPLSEDGRRVDMLFGCAVHPD